MNVVLTKVAEWGHTRQARVFRPGGPPELKAPQLTFPFVRAPHPSAEKLIASLTPDIIEAAQQAVISARKSPLVYTSFDGDHMHLVDSMCYVTHSLQSVPVNPEAALGYYISTTHHAGKKTEVMRDCISLEMACKEFWIFSRKNILENGTLPEGVIAELLLWKQWKLDEAIRFFDLDEIDACFFDHNSAACALPIAHPRKPGAGNALFDEILARHAKTDLQELDMGFILNVNEEGTRPLAFLSVDPLELKHIDWARLKVYSLGKVPFSPDTLVRHFPLRVAAQTDFSTAYNTARAALLLATKELFIFLRPTSGANSTTPCRQILLDLAAWNLAGKGLDNVHFVTWRDAEVPKFQPYSRWALTSAEDRQNRGPTRSPK